MTNATTTATRNDIEWKNKFAAREVAQEAAAYLAEMNAEIEAEIADDDAPKPWFLAKSRKPNDSRVFAVRKLRIDNDRVVVAVKGNSTYYIYIREAKDAKRWLVLVTASSGKPAKVNADSSAKLNAHVATMGTWI